MVWAPRVPAARGPFEAAVEDLFLSSSRTVETPGQGNHALQLLQGSTYEKVGFRSHCVPYRPFRRLPSVGQVDGPVLLQDLIEYLAGLTFFHGWLIRPDTLSPWGSPTHPVPNTGSSMMAPGKCPQDQHDGTFHSLCIWRGCQGAPKRVQMMRDEETHSTRSRPPVRQVGLAQSHPDQRCGGRPRHVGFGSYIQLLALYPLVQCHLLRRIGRGVIRTLGAAGRPLVPEASGIGAVAIDGYLYHGQHFFAADCGPGPCLLQLERNSDGVGRHLAVARAAIGLEVSAQLAFRKR